MTDIFDEVTAELRRDQSSALWRRYGRYVIGAAVAVVLIVASVIAYDSWKTAGQEAASERYDALLRTLEETPAGDAREALIEQFLAQNNGGYDVLASFVSAFELAENGDKLAAVARFDGLAARGDVPLALRDFSRLQSAIVLLDANASFEDIEARLSRLLVDGNDMRPLAREVLALAHMAHDQLLDARAVLNEQIEDPMSNNLSRDRARIMLSIVEQGLGSPSATATE